MNPIQDFYCDIDMHYNIIARFILESDATGFLAGQPWWDTVEGRINVYDGLSAQKVMQFNLDVIDEDNMASDDDTKVPTQQSVKAYVDALENELASVLNGEGASKIGVEDAGGYYTGTTVEAVLQELGASFSTLTGVLDFQGDIDASLNPNYPAAVTGHCYYVTVAGKVGGASGKTVNVGDFVVAKADNVGGTEAAVGTSWFVLESNRDQATELVLGVAKIATQAITNAGTNDTDIVTPLKLKTRLQNIGTVVQETQAVIGSASSAVIAVGVGAGGTFTVAGDVTNDIDAGCIIRITGSTNNDGFKTVVSAVFGGVNTVITISGVVNPVADGTLVRGVKNSITMLNVEVNGNDAHHQVHDTVNRQEVFPYVFYSGTSVINVWFRSPATGSFAAIVQGPFANW